jgi:hypothetical protein
MEYPKAVMTLNELVEMGSKRKELLTIYRSRNNGIAWKTGRAGKTSTILFSTQDLEKYRKAKCTGI